MSPARVAVAAYQMAAATGDPAALASAGAAMAAALRRQAAQEAGFLPLPPVATGPRLVVDNTRASA